MTEERGPISIPQPETVSVAIPTAAILGASTSSPAVVTTQKGDLVASPTSTEEQDRVSAGQRNINLIWEHTQMKIALSVIWISLLVSAILAVTGKALGSLEVQLASIVFLYGVANLVTGFYFGRSNHQKTGGVGASDAGR